MLLAGAPGPAHAEPPATRHDVANSLFWEGRRAAEAGDLGTACDRFARSLALERLPGTLLNLASCEESRGNVASAWLRYRDALVRMKPDDRRFTLASDRALLLEPRVPRLTLRAPEPRPAGLRVSLDGEPLGEDAFGGVRPLDPGIHRVRVTANGRALREIQVVLGAAESKEIAVAPGAAVAPPPVGPIAATPPTGLVSVAAPSFAAPLSAQRVAGYSLLGLGGAGLVLGAIAGGMVLVEKGTFDQHCSATAGCRDQAGLDAANRGVAWADTSNVAFAAGATAAALGLVLVLTSPSRPASKGAERVTAAR